MKVTKGSSSMIKWAAQAFTRSKNIHIVNAYWHDKVPNFGDLLNPIILKYYGLLAYHSVPQSADLVALGSVLHLFQEDYSGFIVGSGLLAKKDKKFPSARILAVRGRLTQECIGAEDNTTLGDPGLLVPFLFQKPKRKNYTLGIVPHYVDKSDKRIERLHSRFPRHIHIIDVKRKPSWVVNQIAQCEFILSSSLHGLITADAYGIPNAWIHLSDNVLGEGFKFYDYASAFDTSIIQKQISGKEKLQALLDLTESRVKNLSVIQSNLDNVFKIMAQEVCDNG